MKTLAQKEGEWAPPVVAVAPENQTGRGAGAGQENQAKAARLNPSNPKKVLDLHRQHPSNSRQHGIMGNRTSARSTNDGCVLQKALCELISSVFQSRGYLRMLSRLMVRISNSHLET